MKVKDLAQYRNLNYDKGSKVEKQHWIQLNLKYRNDQE